VTTLHTYKKDIYSDTYKPTHRKPTKQPGFHTVQWSPDGQYICAGQYEPRITVINTHSFKIAATLDPEIFTDSGRTCVLFSHLDNRLLTTAYNTLCIWEERRGKFHLADKLSTRRYGHLVDIALSPDNLKVAALEDCENTCHIQVWSLSGGRKIRGRELPRLASRIGWSPDGRRIAVGEFHGDGISFWASTTLKSDPLSAPLPAQTSVQSLVFHPEGRLLFVGTEDGRLLALDIEND
jgi:WD40 repeat protein